MIGRFELKVIEKREGIKAMAQVWCKDKSRFEFVINVINFVYKIAQNISA
jgi:hypothetical protein